MTVKKKKRKEKHRFGSEGEGLKECVWPDRSGGRKQRRAEVRQGGRQKEMKEIKGDEEWRRGRHEEGEGYREERSKWERWLLHVQFTSCVLISLFAF